LVVFLYKRGEFRPGGLGGGFHKLLLLKFYEAAFLKY
jgi:hypothetical protein